MIARALRRFLLWLARSVASHYGFRVVPETPASLLPSRVAGIRSIIERSGHLGHRYHVRRALNAAVDETDRLVERLHGGDAA